MTQPSPKASAGQSRAALALLAAAVLFAGATELRRAGYSPDEEFTAFAVNGIRAGGLPILPSGLLYDRGVLYSYASWLAGATSVFQLPAYRAVSLLSAIVALAMVFALVQRCASTTAALLASLLVACSMPFWATATTARFYAPFLLSYVSALLALGTLGTTHLGTIGTLGTIALLSALSRSLHELAFLLPAIPIACAMLDSASARRQWLNAAAAVVGGLVCAQLLLFVLHFLAPSSGETMIRRFFLWQVLNLFETPPDRQYGIVLAAMVIGWLAAPRRAWLISVVALSGVALVATYSIARASNAAPVSRELIGAVMVEGARYPLDMFWHLARVTPVTLLTAMALMITRLIKGGWPIAHRAIHLLWIGWVLWFGVVESGITINYLLVPVSMMLIAIAVDLSTIAIPRIVIALVALAIVGDQWRGEGSPTARLAAARPTITAPGIDEIRHSLQPTDRVVCTDELGCLMLVNRIDMWLALDDYVRERFLVRRGEKIVGVYTGVPAVLRPADLFAPRQDGRPVERTLIVDIFKDYPIGDSRTWLPRALETGGLQVMPLLETPQLRVLQVSQVPLSSPARLLSCCGMPGHPTESRRGRTRAPQALRHQRQARRRFS